MATFACTTCIAVMTKKKQSKPYDQKQIDFRDPRHINLHLRLLLGGGVDPMHNLPTDIDIGPRSGRFSTI